MLKFKNTYPVRKTLITVHSEENHSDGNYTKSCSVSTRYGIVETYQMDWGHNHGRDTYTSFCTVHRGYHFRATYPKAQVTERTLKRLSSIFMKQVTSKR